MSLELHCELLATSGISETAHRTQRHLTQDDESCRIQNCRIQHTTPKSLMLGRKKKTMQIYDQYRTYSKMASASFTTIG